MIDCAVLNRLRGTGDLVKVGKLKITGVMVYAIYLLVLIGLVTEWYYGLAFTVMFLIGESYAWGKWVGYLVDYEDEHTPEYDSKVGKSFPYIHYIANYIIGEKADYERYCQVALAIRGLVWWLPVYTVLGIAGLISSIEVVLIGLILAIGFPLACYIGSWWTYERKLGILEFKQGWENQEIVYGLLQGLCLWYVILRLVYV